MHRFGDLFGDFLLRHDLHSGPHHRTDGIIERDLALAAVAAAKALAADVVVAGVLGAAGADARRFLSTNVARECHGGGHFFFPVFLAGGAIRMARQRCASWSITSNCFSRSAASVTR